MIPKKIHYCWFGRNPKPKLAKKCIRSWKKHCPDYEIIEWNEDNFDLNAAPLYVRQAYEAQKWAFVTDYVRLKVVYDHGGIYMDTDVELLKNLDFLLSYNAYFGLEDINYVATGLGFGAEKATCVLREMMEDYEDLPFILPDGSYDSTPCPQRNTNALLRCGLQKNDIKQILDGNILILPTVYMCPVSSVDGKNKKTKETMSIHWFSASWQTKEQQKRRREMVNRIKKVNRIHFITHLPNRMLMTILDRERYEDLKKRLKK